MALWKEKIFSKIYQNSYLIYSHVKLSAILFPRLAQIANTCRRPYHLRLDRRPTDRWTLPSTLSSCFTVDKYINLCKCVFTCKTVRYFIHQVSPDCKYLQTTVSFEVGQETFTCTGKTLLSPGFTSVMTWQAIPSDESLPACSAGDECSINEVRLSVRLSVCAGEECSINEVRLSLGLINRKVWISAKLIDFCRFWEEMFSKKIVISYRF